MRPLFAKAIKAGERVVKEHFGVDEDICTGDHACIRLSGCPSLSVKHTDDPLKDDPVAAIDESCVGCGNCGEVAEAAVLCPSFYRAEIIHNPDALGIAGCDRTRSAVIGWLETRRQRGRVAARRRRARERRRVRRRTRRRRASRSPFSPWAGRAAACSPTGSSRSRKREGWAAQSTSVPGVAQRTGATIYYIEMAPRADGARRSSR